MAKMNLQEQISSTSYRQSSCEDFEDFITQPIQKISDSRIIMLPIDQLVEYKDEMLEQIIGQPQPFRPYNSENLASLAKSISEYGVIDPITVRPFGNGKYQILAGRNRTRASSLCGKTEIPAIIREDINDISAAMIMLDTNLEQRHNLSYSEKAYAYKMRLDLQNRQGRRTDLQKNGQKFDTLSETGKEHKDSRRMVAYLIRLTFLNRNLLLLVDSGKIGFKVGVAISYLTAETQEYLLTNIIPKGIKLKASQINELRHLEECSPLRPETIQSIFNTQTKNYPSSITISGKKLREYADILTETKNIESLFLEFLKQYKNSIKT